MTASPARFDLDRFINDIKAARREKASQSAVEEVIARAVSEPGSVIQALGEPKEGDITPLYKDDEVSIFNVVWSPLMILAPHDHLMWVSMGIYTGREDNIVWERRGESIAASTAASLSRKEVFSLPEDGIHSVTNPIDKLTGAIHIYGGDLTTREQRSQWDPETLTPQPFDFEETRRMFEVANARVRRG